VKYNSSPSKPPDPSIMHEWEDTRLVCRWCGRSLSAIVSDISLYAPDYCPERDRLKRQEAQEAGK
jgi:hypothetical protein